MDLQDVFEKAFKSDAKKTPAKKKSAEDKEGTKKIPAGGGNAKKPGAKKQAAKSIEPAAVAKPQKKPEPVKNSAPAKNGRKSAENKAKKGAIIAACTLAALCVLLLVGCVMVRNVNTIYPRVSIDNVELGGLSAVEAAIILEDAGFGAVDDLTVTVLLPLDKSITINALDAVSTSGATAAAIAAYEYGRGGNMLSNLFTYLKCVVVGAELPAESVFRLDEDYVRGVVNETVQEINLALMGSGVTIEETCIEVIKGAKSMHVSADGIYDLIEAAFAEGDFSVIEYTPDISGSDSEIDLPALYDTVFREPENASYDSENDEVTESQQGVSFDIEGARAMWNAAKTGDVVRIPLIFEDPEMTAEMLRDLLFRDLLSQKTTTLTYSYNRNVNVTLAAGSINGLVLTPGEEFSYNGVVGKRTAEKGYLPAGAYSNGKEVTETGGGICQVSSTLYYCSLIANLEITNRLCHYFGVSYLPAGLDATVSWPSPDFKFKNNRDYPIKIVAYTNLDNRTLTVEIYGTDTDGSYVVMETEPWSGEKTFGARSYRCIYSRDGALISRTLEARSEYHYHVEEEEESPDISESPDVSEEPAVSESPTVTEDPPDESPPVSEPVDGTDVTEDVGTDPDPEPGETDAPPETPEATRPV